MISIDQAILQFRADPRMSELVRDAYLDRDVVAAAERFFHSAEFAEVKTRLDGKWRGGVVVDVGAGAGIASYAFARSGAAQVYAVEPDPSDEVGRGAIARLPQDLPIIIIDAVGEGIPLPDASVDVVYARQVLHHIPDLPMAMHECARILKPGGIFFACREHVVDDANQKQIFLENHPMHQLAGNENAYSLDEYQRAIRQANMMLTTILYPWDSLINAFPEVRTQQELDTFHVKLLHRKLGVLGSVFSYIPGMNALVRYRFSHISNPGRMFSFYAIKQKA